jgi:hypothetical protein
MFNDKYNTRTGLRLNSYYMPVHNMPQIYYGVQRKDFWEAPQRKLLSATWKWKGNTWQETKDFRVRVAMLPTLVYGDTNITSAGM